MMGSPERAMLYLIRKKQNSVLLFAILTVIASLVLICISIENATEAASRNIRETIGGYFKIQTNAEQGYRQAVDDKLVQAVMKSDGMKSFNGLDTSYMITKSLTLTPGRFTAAGDPKEKLARFIGNTDSELNEYFILRSFSLKEGRHIRPDDTGKALISKELALANALSVGDTFTAVIDTEGFTEMQSDSVQAYTYEIVGIYQINTSQTSGSVDSAECDIAENFIFTDTASLRAIHEAVIGRKINAYQGGAAFFVKDPKELDKVTKQLLEMKDYDWDGYQIIKNNTAYNRSVIPLERASGFLTTIIIILIVISITLLSLILLMWMRDRMHEIGILLSIGIKKFSIIGQHVLENLMIAAIALLLAWGIANIAANTLGDKLLAKIWEEPAAVSEEQSEYERVGAITTPEVNTDSVIQIRAGGLEFFETVGIGVFIVVLATGFSSILVIHRKPRDILSTIS